MPNVDLDSGGTYYSGTIGDDTDGIYYVSNSSILIINSDWDINGLHVGKDSVGNSEIGYLKVRAGYSILFTDNSSALFYVWNLGQVSEDTGYETAYDDIFTIRSASGYDPANRFPFHIACAGSNFSLNWYELQGNDVCLTGQSNSPQYHINLSKHARGINEGPKSIFMVQPRKGKTSRIKWDGYEADTLSVRGRFSLDSDVTKIRQIRDIKTTQTITVNFVDVMDIYLDYKITNFRGVESSRSPFQKDFVLTLQEVVT